MWRKKLLLISSLIAICLVTLVQATPTGAQQETNRKPAARDHYQYEDLSEYFTDYDDGTFVLYDENARLFTIHNDQLSKTRLSPFSTFKIVHALIGLETGVLQDENTTFRWIGYRYEIEAWNSDQTLSAAINNSTIWYFQRVAAEVGHQRMQSYLNKISYGNKDISGGLIDFWLNSSLLTSAQEQVNILRRLYNNDLPFSQKHMDTVKRILKQDEQNGSSLYGKTGGNGWYVGYVETDNNTYYFATKIMTPGIANGSKAKAVALNILRDKGIFVPAQATTLQLAA